jgi:hypothetical protein
VPSERLAEYTRTRPIFTVDLDAGVFFWLQEIMTAKRRNIIPSRPQEYIELVDRGLLAFKAAYDAKESNVTAATTPAKPVRKIKRREESNAARGEPA